MAMSQEQIRGLDHLRQRLSQLSTSVQTLRGDLEQKDPLPSWTSLQTTAQLLSFNLQQLSETMDGHRQFLKEAHAYPLTTFPGDRHENLLGQLLRKKLEVGAASWIDEYTKSEMATVTTIGDPADRLSTEEFVDLWNWAAPTSGGIVGPMLEEGGDFEDDFTIAEREAGVDNVVTGLRRKLGGEDEEEDQADGDDGEDKMEEDIETRVEPTAREEGVDPSLPPIPLDSMLRFMTTGVLPPNSQVLNR